MTESWFSEASYKAIVKERDAALAEVRRLQAEAKCTGAERDNLRTAIRKVLHGGQLKEDAANMLLEALGARP